MTNTETRDLVLAIDLGTGSVRAALVDFRGTIVAIEGVQHEQIVPAFGWSEQRPRDWWNGVVLAVRRLLEAHPEAKGRLAALSAGGQMHATVLIDADGQPTLEAVPLWNDKRTVDYVTAFEASERVEDWLPLTGNPPTPAWPAFKLQWIRDHAPEAYARAVAVMMPKDWINFRLTGIPGMDFTEAACSFLMDAATGQWSQTLATRMGLDLAKMPPIRKPTEVLGAVTAAAAAETGLPEGLLVVVGCADYSLALLGSGVCKPGDGSEVIGTSCIITQIAERPTLDPEICNVGTALTDWGAFMLLESGGDAVRWARRALHRDEISYSEVSALAAKAVPGAQGLFFIPYLMGERLGRHRNARAQFFGLGARHGAEEMHRAVLEGVAFAVKRNIDILHRRSGQSIKLIVASGGGVKDDLWMKIKASVYGVPITVPAEAECSLVGAGIVAAVAIGHQPDCIRAAAAMVRHQGQVLPDPAWQETYARMQPVFERLYLHSQEFYDDLDAL